MKRFLFLIPVIAVIFAGCDLVYNVDAQDEHTETYDAASYTKIDMNNKAGEVIFTSAATESILVTYTKKCRGTSETDAEEHLSDIKVEVSGEAGIITVNTDFPVVDIGTREYQIVFEITAPSDVELDIVNTTGDITVTGLTEAPYLETTTGSISVFDIECGINAKSTTDTVNCRIKNLPESANVDIETTSGTQILEINDLDTATVHNINMDATSGDCSVTMPSYASYNFDLKTTSGGNVDIAEGINHDHEDGVDPWTSIHKVGWVGESDTKSDLTVEAEDGDIDLYQGN